MLPSKITIIGLQLIIIGFVFFGKFKNFCIYSKDIESFGKLYWVV